MFPLTLNTSYICTQKNQERVQSSQMHLCAEGRKHMQTGFVHLAGVNKAGSRICITLLTQCYTSGNSPCLLNHLFSTKIYKFFCSQNHSLTEFIEALKLIKYISCRVMIFLKYFLTLEYSYFLIWSSVQSPLSFFPLSPKIHLTSLCFIYKIYICFSGNLGCCRILLKVFTFGAFLISSSLNITFLRS